MNGFVTTNRYARVYNLPITLAQTELRAGKAFVVARFPLALFQRLELRSLTLFVNAILTPGVVPIYLNTSMGLACAGLYNSPMLTSPLAYTAFTEQASTTNPFSPCVIETPGIYSVIVSNNTSNTDLSLTVTGTIKFYY